LPPYPPAPKKQTQNQPASRCSNFSGPQDPPIRVVKHTLSGLLPPIHVAKPYFMAFYLQSVWQFPDFIALYLQYGPTGSPDGHNMASIQVHSAQYDSKWPSDSPTWPHIVLRPTKMPSRQLQTWPEDSPRRVIMNFSVSYSTSTKGFLKLVLCASHQSESYRAKL
jgi:hypothetical protein